jgi:dihydrofolate reductase
MDKVRILDGVDHPSICDEFVSVRRSDGQERRRHGQGGHRHEHVPDLIEETGAVIMGRRTYDNSIPDWGGKGPLDDVPCFVVTHNPPASAGPIFAFVTDGIESALARAREAAGEKPIGLTGANIDQQFLAAGLVDEIRIHVIDVLGGGRRLFDQFPKRIELERTGLGETGGITHLEDRVVR